MSLENVSRYWADRRVPGLSLLCADFTTHEFPPHSHEAFVIAVTEYGGAEVRSRGQVDYARSSALLVFNPAEPHAGRMGLSERWRYRSLYLTQRAIDAVVDGLGIGSMPYFTQNVIIDRDLTQAFLALHRVLEQGRSPLSEHELLYTSFGCLFERHGGRRRHDAAIDTRLVGRVIDYLHAHLVEEQTLDGLGERFALTPFQLIRMFKRAVGLTPHAYLTQLRLNEACRLLRRGQAIADVAAAVGLYDQSALNRHFKRCYGITPLQFANAAGKDPGHAGRVSR